MKKILCITLALLLVPLAAYGQIVNDKSTVLNTLHDTDAGGNGCLNCHVPHQPSAKGRTLLWAPAFTTQVFGVYDSVTLDNKATEVGDPTYGPLNPPVGALTRTVLCLSCHDGVTSPALIVSTDGAAIANPVEADGLRNDHPVNMNFDPALEPGLHPIATVQATNVRLFTEGANETVQCASCHDPHNAPGLPKFLRVDNSNSGLCITCHQ